jgi:hypothetical protein
MDSADLLRDLGAILRDVAFREILPRFRALAASEVHSKATTEDPDDLVTLADHAAEATLLASLPANGVGRGPCLARSPNLVPRTECTHVCGRTTRDAGDHCTVPD